MKNWNSARSRDYRAKLFLKQNKRCHLCHEEMTIEKHFCLDPEYATFDHLIPRSRGGRTNLSNILLAHRRCNEARGSQDLVA